MWKIYASELADYFPCHAFWQFEKDNKASPGAVGWLDDEGVWRNEYHLRNIATSLPPPDQNTQNKWGPRASRSIETSKKSISAEARPAGVPARFQAQGSYKSFASTGALLVTKHQIIRKQYDFDTDFEQWVYANARWLRNEHRQLSITGFYVVTKTYTAEKCWNTGWKKKTQKGMLNLDATVYDCVRARARHEWLVDHSSTTWNESADGNTAVVAFGGLYFRYCMVRWYHVHRLSVRNRRHFYWWDPEKPLRAFTAPAPLPMQGHETVPKEAAKEVTEAQLMEMVEEAKREKEHSLENPDRFFLFADKELNPFTDPFNEFDYVVEYCLCHVALDANYNVPLALESRASLTSSSLVALSNTKIPPVQEFTEPKSSFDGHELSSLRRPIATTNPMSQWQPSIKDTWYQGFDSTKVSRSHLVAESRSGDRGGNENVRGAGILEEKKERKKRRR